MKLILHAEHKVIPPIDDKAIFSKLIDGAAIDMVNEINRFYNCEMVSKHIANNILCRRDKVSTKFHNVL
jgi:hypothetical protein